MYIDEAGLRLLVSQEVLQIRRGIPFHRFIGGASVSEGVATEFLANARKLPVLLNNIHHASYG